MKLTDITVGMKIVVRRNTYGLPRRNEDLDPVNHIEQATVVAVQPRGTRLDTVTLPDGTEQGVRWFRSDGSPTVWTTRKSDPHLAAPFTPGQIVRPWDDEFEQLRAELDAQSELARKEREQREAAEDAEWEATVKAKLVELVGQEKADRIAPYRGRYNLPSLAELMDLLRQAAGL